MSRRITNQKKIKITAAKDKDQLQSLPAKDDLIARYQAKEREEKEIDEQITQERQRKISQGRIVPIQKGKESTFYAEFLMPEQKEQYIEQRAYLYSAIFKLTEMSGYGRNIVKDVLEDMLKRIKYEEKLRSEDIQTAVSIKTQEKLRELRRMQLRKKRSEDLLSLFDELQFMKLSSK
jgi:hypothetical protein